MHEERSMSSGRGIGSGFWYNKIPDLTKEKSTADGTRQHLGVDWSRQQPTPSGDPSAGGHFAVHQNGNLFSLCCGQSGFTGTKLFLEVAPLQSMQFSTT